MEPRINDVITSPVVWADGFGIWHCRLPKSPSSYRIARKRITDQLDMRGQIRRGDHVYLERIHEYGDGSIEYTEHRD